MGLGHGILQNTQHLVIKGQSSPLSVTASVGQSTAGDHKVRLCGIWLPCWYSMQSPEHCTVTEISLGSLFTSPQDSCHLPASTGHGPVSQTGPLQARSLVVKFCNHLLSKSIQVLSPERAQASRTGAQSMGCPRATAHPIWRRNSTLQCYRLFITIPAISRHCSPGIR